MALGDGFFVPSSGDHLFSPDFTSLFLRLPLQAIGPDTEAATFHLTSQDDPPYDKTLTMKDDLVQGDEFAELLFEEVFTRGRFTLEVDPGGGKPKFTVFKEKSFLDLSEGPSPAQPPPADPEQAPSAADLKAAKQREQYE
jgi:hypothetical protein